jgi:hypothetical protein
MSTQPLLPTSSPAKSTFVPHRRIASMGTFRAQGHYRGMMIKETFPSYDSLTGVVDILAHVMDSPASWAHAKLREMTARDANWKDLESAPPNNVAENLALKVLKAAHSFRPLEPSYVTASAEGGVGIVYRSAKNYSAFECLNTGDLRLLWFDLSGKPHSKKISPRAIRQALKQIEAIHTPNARSTEPF